MTAPDLELFGRSDPRGSDGYRPGAWDQVRAAFLDGHITEEAYEIVRQALMAALTVDPLQHTLEYAATALEASSDNGDKYCASQIRTHLALHQPQTAGPSDS